MYRSIIFFTIVVQVAFSFTAFAQDGGSRCAKDLKSYKDVIKCAESNSPEILIVGAELAKAKSEIQAASQRSNPELSSEWVTGKSGGESTSEVDVGIGIPIELGGKVSARRSVAEGGVLKAEARLAEVSAKVKSDVLIKLHRLRQLYHEQEIIDEAIGTFSKLVDQFARRPVLSPEQQMSNSVFRMSKSEYEIKRVETLEGIAALNTYFTLTVSKGAEDLRKLVPQSLKVWPEIKSDFESGASATARVALADLQTSKASLLVAQSEAWPTLTFGPSLKLQSQGGKTEQMYGLNMSFPLPIFNSNGGAKASAASEVTVSETKKEQVLSEEMKRREELLGVYNESKRVLMASISTDEIGGRHKEIDSLFVKGIVPSALVIEAHRTVFELEQSRNQRELKAIEALLGIYFLDGKISELDL